MTEKIAFEVGNPTSNIEKIWEKNWNEMIFFTPCLFLTHVYNHHDSKRISSDPFHSPIIY